MQDNKTIDQLSINTLRFLAIDAIQKANSGHPGMPMGAAPMAYTLWDKFLKHNPANPNWPERDRFVLSAGHGSALLYALLHLTGYGLTIEDLKNFRQWGSKTPGHPEYGHTQGIETTTGPLGQGFANSVGMALAEQSLAARFNKEGYKIVDHYTYCLVGDGDLMEGISHEAASFAGHLRLNKLICLYDDNHISIEGNTDIAFTEDQQARFTAYGWQVQQLEDGNDLEAIAAAIRAAQEETSRPSLIAIRTYIGYGSPNKQDTSSVHGEPLGDNEIKATRKNLNWPADTTFFVPNETLHHCRQALERGKLQEEEWQKLLALYHAAHPELAHEFTQRLNRELPSDWDQDIPLFPTDAKGKASRVASGEVLNTIAKRLPSLIGGSADLAPSTKTLISGEQGFQHGSYEMRNIHFGVREHGMGGVINGMALHGGFIPYGATFLIFSDYMRPAIRLASLMGLQVIYIFTHDSIGLGEDGPTHQPVEQLASLRAIPNLLVIRPADANETAEAWRIAITSKNRPTTLALTRQALPTLDRDKMNSAAGVANGGYILKDFGSDTPQIILLASGSEVHLALDAAQILSNKGKNVRVVSLPCLELFNEQPEEYRNSVLPPASKLRVAVEAAIPQGWHELVGDKGEIIAINHFGASAPANELYQRFGITTEKIVETVIRLSGDRGQDTTDLD